MTERTFTAAEMETMAGALPKLRGHMPDCGCSICGQMETVAAMLRQGAEAESRWERLRAEASDDYDSVESSNVGDTILHIMARLEKERTA